MEVGSWVRVGVKTVGLEVAVLLPWCTATRDGECKWQWRCELIQVKFEKTALRSLQMHKTVITKILSSEIRPKQVLRKVSKITLAGH